MKKLVIALGLLAACFTASARDPQRGYRGFIDWDNSLTTYQTWTPGHREAFFHTGFSTAHGFQFNPHLFVGAGIGYEHCSKNGGNLAPVFAVVRTDLHWGRFTPFGDLRIGYSLTDGGGVYFAPTVGYRFNWGRKMGINVGVGMAVRGGKLDVYSLEPVEGPDGYLIFTYLVKQHFHKCYFTFKLGIDF